MGSHPFARRTDLRADEMVQWKHVSHETFDLSSFIVAGILDEYLFHGAPGRIPTFAVCSPATFEAVKQMSL